MCLTVASHLLLAGSDALGWLVLRCWVELWDLGLGLVCLCVCEGCLIRTDQQPVQATGCL